MGEGPDPGPGADLVALAEPLGVDEDAARASCVTASARAVLGHPLLLRGGDPGNIGSDRISLAASSATGNEPGPAPGANAGWRCTGTG